MVIEDITYQTVTFIVGMTAVLASFGVVLCASPIYSALYLIGNMICLAGHEFWVSKYSCLRLIPTKKTLGAMNLLYRYENCGKSWKRKYKKKQTKPGRFSENKNHKTESPFLTKLRDKTLPWWKGLSHQFDCVCILQK